MRGETVSFESLERRQLFSTVNVANFGAHPNDGANDLPAIQAALNASKPGDTILFSGGVFDLSGFGNSGGDGLKVPSDRIYKGQNGAVLRGHDSRGPQMHVTGDNVTITGLTFQDGGLKVDKGSNLNNNIVIDNNVFNLNTGGANNNGITATSGLSNSKITNNYFTGNQGVFGILAFNWKGLTIANNEFVNIKAGVHMQGFGGSTNLLFEQNYFSGVRGGMGAEIVSNSSITNCTFQDNYYENPNQGSMTHDQLLNFMAFSFPTPTCTNTIIRRNIVIAPQRPDGKGVRIGIETAGKNCLVEDNYVVGCEWGITDADGTTPSSVTIRNNYMSDAVWHGIRQDHAAAGRTLIQSNNGSNVTLSSTMQNRIAKKIKPGRNKRLEDGGTTSTATPQVAHSSGDSSSATAVALSDLKWESATSSWGPVETNQSVGGKNAKDGKKITIDGHTYLKGLATAGNSEITYDLNGKYGIFRSDIGVDEQAGKKGSVKFQVFADGKLIYDSVVMRGSDGSKRVSLDVQSVKTLKLVTTNAGDGGNSDLADWARARLLTV